MPSVSRISALVALLHTVHGQIQVDIDWNNAIIKSKTGTTLQVVVNPPLLANSSVHDEAMKSLRLVSSDYARFVPWFPYPKLAVPEIDEPTTVDGQCVTSWDFTYADQLLGDFLENTPDAKHIINFSTTPTWMWKLDSPYYYPEDINEIFWNYNNGTELRDPSYKEIADYYQRLINWWVNGGFTDECGVYHESGHNWPIEYWEVLNEPEAEHAFQPETYTKFYDAVSAAIHEVAPQIQFVGMGLATRNTSWPEYFLDKDNHESSGIWPEFMSYHFYAQPQGAAEEEMALSAFAQADTFIAEVQSFEEIRQRLSPDMKTTLNEIGTMSPTDPVSPEYWTYSGGVYAYVFSRTAGLGIDVVGESQLLGYPGQYPSVSMVDWETGKPNARLRVLQLLLSEFQHGDELVSTSSDEARVHAQAFRTAAGRKVLLVNKTGSTQVVPLGDFARSIARTVDGATAGGEWRTEDVLNSEVHLPPYAISVIIEQQ